MRILVTGAAGFVGHHFVEAVLRTTNWEVVGIASFRHRGCPLRLRHLVEEPRLKIIRTELGAPILARVAAEIGEIDTIVNFAAESHVDRSIEDPRPFVINNVELVLTMLEYARMAKPARFIQFSTDEVYGPAPAGTQHKEWDAVLPSNPYAASKAAQEAVAFSYWRTFGLPVTFINGMNLIGERQDREKFLPMLIKGIQAGEEVTIHGSSAGIGSRMYLHARNLADGIMWLIEKTAPVQYPDDDRPDRWHIAGEREVSNLELAIMVAAVLERPLRYKLVDFHQARPGHDRRYALDANKIRDAGWKQPLDLEQSLERSVRWTIRHPEWMV